VIFDIKMALGLQGLKKHMREKDYKGCRHSLENIGDKIED